MSSAAGAIAGVDMAALLADPTVQKAAPEAPLEAAIKDITPESATAELGEGAFEFRALLNDEQREALKKAAPAVAENMVKNHSAIINFGAPVLDKMNQASIAMLKEQKHVKIPEADEIINNLLREMDGYSAKYRNVKMENFAAKIKKMFGGAGYTLKTMIRDAQPIAKRIDEAEVKVRQMELDLEKNGERARRLHDETLETMDSVVAVLAALEEISIYLKERFKLVDEQLQAVGDTDSVIEFEGQKYSVQQFKELHADIAQGISEVDKSWHDWRAQFFLAFATAPNQRNLILISSSMQRRLHVFRTQALPSARRGLAQWQQAILAKDGAALGESLQRGTNAIIQSAAGATADAVEAVARASQAPVITEETVFALIDSVKAQANSLVEADKWGREYRARTLAAFEKGEQEIAVADEEGRRKLVENAVAAARGTVDTSGAPSMPESDILGSLGVKG